MNNRTLPPEAGFMSLAAIEAKERNSRSGGRGGRSVDKPAQIGNGGPLAPKDGILAPTAWEGAAIPPRHWIVKNIIPTGEVTMLTGNGGEGKSLIAMQLLIAASTGTRWLGREIKAIRSMGMFCEDDRDELHRRTNQVLSGERMEFSMLDDLTMVCRKGKDSILFDAQFNDMTGQFTPFFERLRATATELGAQVLVLDSLYDFFGGNENSKTQVKQFINGLAELAYDLNGAVIIIAHPSLSGMGSGTGTAGSTAWHNAVRSRLYLHRRKVAQWELDKNPNARGALVLQPMKSNYGPPEDAIELLWEEGRFVPVVDPHLSTPPERGTTLFGDEL